MHGNPISWFDGALMGCIEGEEGGEVVDGDPQRVGLRLEPDFRSSCTMEMELKNEDGMNQRER